jgi:hypothetical protein
MQHSTSQYDDLARVPRARTREGSRRGTRTTNAIERLHEEFKRRIKTQTVLPSAETAAMLFWALLASGQINIELRSNLGAKGRIHPRTRQGSRKAGSTLIDCRRGASNGVRRGPGLIVLRRSMKSRTIGGVRWGSRHGDTGQSAKQDR